LSGGVGFPAVDEETVDEEVTVDDEEVLVVRPPPMILNI
jgi:hypothetical protein